jgi:5-methylcytosine-specific restriction endonuclease McrA
MLELKGVVCVLQLGGNNTEKNTKKVRALNRIGGPVCVLCGCRELIFLSVDHASKDGSKHRRAIGSSGGDGILRWILSVSPEELIRANLRCLCMQCNHATARQSDQEVVDAQKRNDERIRDTPI